MNIGWRKNNYHRDAIAFYEYAKRFYGFMEEHSTHTLSLQESETEPYFSWNACEVCGGIPGNRYDVVLYNQTAKVVEGPFSVCEDCIFMAEYGILSDRSCLDISDHLQSRPRAGRIKAHLKGRGWEEFRMDSVWRFSRTYFKKGEKRIRVVYDREYDRLVIVERKESEMQPKSLEDLRDRINSGDLVELDMTNLPVFAEQCPLGEHYPPNVWSWDHTRILVQTTSGFEIVTPEEWDAMKPKRERRLK